MPQRNGGLARGERPSITLSDQEQEAVEDVRFKHRMPARAAAMRAHFRRGLTAANADAPEPGYGARGIDNACGIRNAPFGRRSC